MVFCGSAKLAQAYTCSPISETVGFGEVSCYVGTPLGPFGPSSGSPEGPVVLPHFDPRLGQLQEVDLILQGAIDFTALITPEPTFPDQGQPCCQEFSVTANASVTFTAPSIVYAEGGTLIQDECCIGAPPFVGEFIVPIVPSGNGFQDYFGSDTAPFVGTGPLTFQVDPFVDASAGGASLSEITFLPDSFTGSGYLNYLFTPAAAPVPEPSMLFVIGAALGGLVIVRKRRQA